MACPALQVGALFAGLSMVEHACAPNACWVNGRRGGAGSPETDMLLVAARPVRRGEHLSISYKADPFQVSGA